MKAKEDHLYDEFFGDIPTVDPMNVNDGTRVVFHVNNRWTLIHRVELSCPDCEGGKSWHWMVCSSARGGEWQQWPCSNKDDFWSKVIHIKDWPKKKARLKAYFAAKDSIRDAEMAAFDKKMAEDPDFRELMKERGYPVDDEDKPGG